MVLFLQNTRIVEAARMSCSNVDIWKEKWLESKLFQAAFCLSKSYCICRTWISFLWLSLKCIFQKYLHFIRTALQEQNRHSNVTEHSWNLLTCMIRTLKGKKPATVRKCLTTYWKLKWSILFQQEEILQVNLSLFGFLFLPAGQDMEPHQGEGSAVCQRCRRPCAGVLLCPGGGDRGWCDRDSHYGNNSHPLWGLGEARCPHQWYVLFPLYLLARCLASPSGGKRFSVLHGVNVLYFLTFPLWWGPLFPALSSWSQNACIIRQRNFARAWDLLFSHMSGASSLPLCWHYSHLAVHFNNTHKYSSFLGSCCSLLHCPGGIIFSFTNFVIFSVCFFWGWSHQFTFLLELWRGNNWIKSIII